MSDYFKTLPQGTKERYIEKLCGLGFTNVMSDDPYLNIKSSKVGVKSSSQLGLGWIDDITKWPTVDFGSVYVYLIDTPGPFTRDNMKSFKSLEAYNFFVSGWVQTCFMRTSDTGYCILKAKVNRSQAVTDKPHEAWVGLRIKDGNVECGHCTCMAGLGEVCSHVAAILFKMEANTRLGFNQVSCTSLPCVWNQSYSKKVEAVPLTEISFEKPRRTKQQQKKTVYQKSSPKLLQTEDPTELLECLRQSSPNAVIFTVTNPKKAPRRKQNLPINLLTLQKNQNLEEVELINVCEKEFDNLNVIPEQCVALEKATREQSKSGLWKQYRAGRLTASNFYDICHTKMDNPSKSLLVRIMNYSSFTCSATSWGLKNEERAREMYMSLAKTMHTNFEMSKCGLVINPQFPYLGCTPDGYVMCDCCGKGTVEIKCPFKLKDKHPCSINDKTFCLPNHDPKPVYCENYLPMEHRYSYQIQGQMGVTECKYCDFICFTNAGIHIERIYYDNSFFKQMLETLTPFFKRNILPELLTGKLKSSMTKCSISENACFCNRNENFGEMITCDSEHCKIKNFHMRCVGLVVAPKGHWYCLSCLNPKKRKTSSSVQ